MGSIVIVPCYNEATRWDEQRWREYFAVGNVEWWFVDDGSTDDTAAVIESTCRLHPDGQARLLRLDRNRGKAEAVRAGLLAVLVDRSLTGVVGFMDADGAFAPSDVERLARLQHELVDRFASVWSSRIALAGRDIRRSLRRHYFSRMVATLICWRDSTIPYDTQSGLKFFGVSDTLRAVLDEPFRTRWMFEVELLARWRRETGSTLPVWEEPLRSWTEMAGSSITAREVVRIARELVVVKRVQARARRASKRIDRAHS